LGAGGDSSGGGGGEGWQSAVWRAAASQAAPEVLEPAVAVAAAAMVQPDKFSVHLIVRAPGGWVFPNCQAVGAAVGALRWVSGNVADPCYPGIWHCTATRMPDKVFLRGGAAFKRWCVVSCSPAQALLPGGMGKLPGGQEHQPAGRHH
jgi:hypothetical protein